MGDTYTMESWILPKEWIISFFSVVCALVVIVPTAHAQTEEPVCEWKSTSAGPDVCFVTLTDTTVSYYYAATAACPAHGHAAYLARFPDRQSFDEVILLNSVAAQYWTSLSYDSWDTKKWLWGDWSKDTWVRLSSTSGCGYVDESDVIQSQSCRNRLTGYICQRVEEHVCTWNTTSRGEVCIVSLTESSVSQGDARSACSAHGDGAYLARFPDQASYDEVMDLGLTSSGSQYWTSLFYQTSVEFLGITGGWKWGDWSADIWTGLSSTSGCGYVDESGGLQSQDCYNQLTRYICQRAVASPALGMTTSEPTTTHDTTTSELTSSRDTTTSEPTTSQDTKTSGPMNSRNTITSASTTSQDTITSASTTSQDTMTSEPTTSKAGMTGNTADSSAKPTGDVAPTNETPNQASNTTAPHTEGPRGNGTSNSTPDPADPNGNKSNSTADPEDSDGKGASNFTTEPAPGCLDLSPCHPACENGGVCVNGACYCPDGFTGIKCHKEVRGLATKNNNVTTCEPCRCLKPAANASRYYCSQCGDPPVLPHTSVYMSTCGETVRYACLPGFLRLRGNATKTCDQERGEWPTWNHLICRNASAEEQKVEIFVPKEELTEDEQFQAKIGWTAADSRPAAIGLGSVVGITFVGILVVAVVVMDALSLAEHVRGCRENLRGQHPRKVKPAKVAPRK